MQESYWKTGERSISELIGMVPLSYARFTKACYKHLQNKT